MPLNTANARTNYQIIPEPTLSIAKPTGDKCSCPSLSLVKKRPFPPPHTLQKDPLSTAAGEQIPTPVYGAEGTPRCTVKSGSLSKELSQPEFARQPHCKLLLPEGCAQRGAGKVRMAREMEESHRPVWAGQGGAIGQVYARHSMSSVISALLPNLMGIP